MNVNSQTIVTGINYCIVVGLILFSNHLPVPDALTPMSMTVLGIFIGTLWGWIVFGMGWPSILGLLSFGMCGYIPMNDALSSAFGTQLIITVLALFLLAAFVEQVNLTEFLLDYLLSRKSCQGNPYIIYFYFLIAGWIAATLSFCSGVFIIMIGFLKLMMEKVGIKPFSKTVVYLFVGMLVSQQMSELTLPFKATGLYSIAAYESVTSEHVNLLKYTLFMIPISFSIITLYVLLGKYLFKPDMSMLARFSHEAKGNMRLDKQQKISLVGIILGMCSLLLPSVIPADWAIGEFLRKLGGGGLSLLVIGILMSIRVDGQPLMNLGKVGRFFIWDIFFCLAFLYPVAGAISSNGLGIKTLLVSGGEAFFGSIPTTLAVIFLIILPAFFTNFMNNAVIGIAALSIYGTIASTINMNSHIMFGLIIFAANLGFFFPSANPLATMAFAEKSIVTSRQLFTFALTIWAILCVWVGIVCCLWGGIIY